LRRTVSGNHRTTAAKVTAELDIHLADHVSTKQSDESFTNPASSVELQLLNLRLLNKTLKGEKDGVMVMKPGRLMNGNRNMVLHVVPNIRPGLCLENTQGVYTNECLFPTVKHGDGSVMICIAISSYYAGLVITSWVISCNLMVT